MLISQTFFLQKLFIHIVALKLPFIYHIGGFYIILFSFPKTETSWQHYLNIPPMLILYIFVKDYDMPGLGCDAFGVGMKSKPY